MQESRTVTVKVHQGLTVLADLAGDILLHVPFRQYLQCSQQPSVHEVHFTDEKSKFYSE